MKRFDHDLARYTVSVFGFHYKNASEIVVAFRGTPITSIRTWHKNLQKEFREYPLLLKLPKGLENPLRVHKGFLEIFESIPPKTWKSLHPELHQVPLSTPIYFVGHSLGGALASFAALKFKLQHRKRNVHLVMINSPRIGNCAFAHFIETALKTPIVRWVQNQDVLAQVPYGENYCHFGTEVWWQPDHPTACCYGIENRKCSSLLFPFKKSVTNHHEIGTHQVFGPWKCLFNSED
jgi:predicted lipase